MRATENWNFYALRVDDNPASNCVDLGVAGAAPISGFDTLSYISVEMNNPRDDGLSSGEELEALGAIEDNLLRLVRGSSKVVYVGRSTHNGTRDFYLYTQGDVLQPVVESLVKEFPSYSMVFGSQPDPDWGVYWRFLYPSPDDFQRMGNRDVLDQLLAHGDAPGLPREIDHFALFEAAGAVQGFVKSLQGTAIGEVNVETDPEGVTTVSFKTFGSLSDIDEVTIALMRAAEAHDGTYDGWGCAATSADPEE